MEQQSVKIGVDKLYIAEVLSDTKEGTEYGITSKSC